MQDDAGSIDTTTERGQETIGRYADKIFDKDIVRRAHRCRLLEERATQTIQIAAKLVQHKGAGISRQKYLHPGILNDPIDLREMLEILMRV